MSECAFCVQIWVRILIPGQLPDMSTTPTTSAPATCWACSTALGESPLLCVACGKVQPPAGLDYFQVFGLARKLQHRPRRPRARIPPPQPPPASRSLRPRHAPGAAMEPRRNRAPQRCLSHPPRSHPARRISAQTRRPRNWRRAFRSQQARRPPAPRRSPRRSLRAQHAA